MTADNESTRHMAISDTAPLLAAMPVSFHQRAEQLYYPSLLRCGNQGRQRHSQILAKQHGLQFISKLNGHRNSKKSCCAAVDLNKE
ncbi:uncharacterized protein PHA67_009130 isoform 2-T2 [Liasis olivaceus]